ncbi:predicted protein [Nematostella vectensis]|uniref:Reticulocalbin-3 n=1 Tax=Nematostella vectensis TaxID=45351 RepID=A7S0S7_NEMVE|nr:predicted protein [Nematostella vectensis]|eukprot:XP_001634852.1 predicted protein [Nematostella vectensis]
MHSAHDDHVAFLGEEMAKEFENLSPEEARRRLRMLVPRIDINKDGFVEEAELEIWIRHKMKKWEVEEDVDAIFRDMDFNNDNHATWKEFMMRTYGFTDEDINKKWERNNLKDYIEDDRRKWKYADQDKDSRLTREEYEYFHHPKEHEVMIPYIAMKVMLEGDKDKDGFLSLQEYLDWLEMPDFHIMDKRDFEEKHDQNKDGKLDLKEVEDWRRPKNFNKALEEAQHLIEHADLNGDGKLSADEIVTSHEFFAGSYATQFGQTFHDEF